MIEKLQNILDKYKSNYMQSPESSYAFYVSRHDFINDPDTVGMTQYKGFPIISVDDQEAGTIRFLANNTNFK